MLRGVRPFFSAKYDITKHPNYKHLSDFNKSNEFDVQKYLTNLRKPHPQIAPDEPFYIFEFEDSEETSEAQNFETVGEIED
jgi:type IV secretion system protein VirD4